MTQVWLEPLQEYGYTAVVLFVGAWLLWRMRRSLAVGEKHEEEQLAARKTIMAVPTAVTGKRRPTEDVKQRGARSIEARFTVHRRLLIPLVGLCVLALAFLPFLGNVPATALSLVVAIVTGVLGVAARPVLENAISGLVMSFSRVIRIGDTVVLDDLYGTVEDISSTHTTIRVWDWRRYVVPNSQMLQSKLINYTLFDQQLWACVEFWVAHDADLQRVRDIAVQVAEQSPHKLPSEPAQLWFLSLDQTALKCWLVAWTDNAAAAWAFKDDVRRRLADGLRTAGIQSHGYRQIVTQPVAREGAGAPA